jgi:hypothetical protein
MASAEEYERYAEYCLKIVRLADNRQDRIIQREMASALLNLAADLRKATAYPKLVAADIDRGTDKGPEAGLDSPPLTRLRARRS